MRYSYSSISTFGQCPFKWKLRYKDKLKTIPDTAPDNALYIGLGLHKGIEEGSADAGVAEYFSHYNIITDDNINWSMQLQHQIPKVLELLPKGGEHELKLETERFVGYVDYVVDNTLFDFKMSNNIASYSKSPQLSIYKHYLEQARPDLHIDSLNYVMVPKIQIRQRTKSGESLQQFRERLQEELEKSEIQIVNVPYSTDSVTDFLECCKFLDSCEDFPKNPTRLCDWCEYKPYCQKGEDWMILTD